MKMGRGLTKRPTAAETQERVRPARSGRSTPSPRTHGSAVLSTTRRADTSSGAIQKPRIAASGPGLPVLLVAPEPFYEDRGTPIAVREVVLALSELDIPVDLVTYPVGRPVELEGLNVFRSPNPLGIRSVPIGFSLRKVALDLSLTRILARRLATRTYGCVHAVEEAAFPAVQLAARYDVPVIYDMQSHLPTQMRQSALFRVPPFPTLMERAQRWVIERADLVACSAGLEGYVRSVREDVPVHAWHYPAMRWNVSTEDVAELRRELELPEGRPVVLYTGSFAPYQGLPRLISAIGATLESAPDALFLLVGGDGRAARGLPPEAAVWRERGVLRTVRRQPRERIAAFLTIADVVVSPREAVGNLPLKVFDYMAASRAIVATDTATHRTVLDETNSRLVAPEDPAAMGRAIATLLMDRPLAAELGRRAASFARDRLGWAAFRGRVQAMYGTFVTTGSHRAP